MADHYVVYLNRLDVIVGIYDTMRDARIVQQAVLRAWDAHCAPIVVWNGSRSKPVEGPRTMAEQNPIPWAEIKPRGITIWFDGSVTLDPAEVWPDGDAPSDITAEAVAEAMRSAGSQSRVMADWALNHYLQVHVGIARGPEVKVW